jgi:hypothetical protein
MPSGRPRSGNPSLISGLKKPSPAAFGLIGLTAVAGAGLAAGAALLCWPPT